MNIHEYLSAKYHVKNPTTMTSIEAQFFEIPYPLQAGWLAEHGKREVTHHAYLNINIALEKREAKKQKNIGRSVKNKTKKNKRVYAVPVLTNSKPQTVVRIPTLAVATSDAFLMSFEWRKLRMVVLKKYGARCQCCGATPADGARMNVDHIKPRRLFPELALTESNLQVLCDECNHGKGNWDQTDWRSTSDN